MKVDLLLFTIFFSLLCFSLNSQVSEMPQIFWQQNDPIPELCEDKKSLIKSPDAISVLKLKKDDCYTNGNGIEICYRGLLEDSRCPPGMQCIWAGNAKLDFELILSDSTIVEFELNTNLKSSIDTTIRNTYILLESLSKKGKPISIAKLLLVNLIELESNAQIVGFNEVSGCTYGYEIETNEETFVSNDYKLRRFIEKKVDHPIDIYIELGNEKRECRNAKGLKNYHLERVVMTQN